MQHGEGPRAHLAKWREDSLVKVKRSVRALLGALVFLAAAYFVYLIRSVLIPFVLGAFISYVLEPVVSFLQDRGLTRGQAIAVVYLLGFLFLGLLAGVFIPNLLRDLREFAAALPGLAFKARSFLERARGLASSGQMPVEFEGAILAVTQRLETTISSITAHLDDFLISSVNVLSYLVLSPVIAYYILKDINVWRGKALFFLAKMGIPWLDLFHDIDTVLAGFVRGQATVAAFVAVAVWGLATVLNLKYAAVLGIIGGLGEFVPVIGPVVAAIPLVFIAFAKNAATGLWALALEAVIQWVDSNILVPRITGTKVGLHPLAVIFSLLCAGKILGVWGVFFAVPAAGIARALLKFSRSLIRNKVSQE